MVTTAVPGVTPSETSSERRHVHWRDAVAGWIFVAPATLITLIFGLYPVIYGFFVSLKGGQVAPKGFVGLLNYIKALGGLGYVVAIGVGIVLLWTAYRSWRSVYNSLQTNRRHFAAYLVPALISAPATLAIGVLIFVEDPSNLVFPVAAILIAVVLCIGVASQTRSSPAVSYALRTWGIVLLALCGLITIPFTFQQIATNTAASFSALQPLFDDAGISLPALDLQLAAAGLVTAALVIALFLRRFQVSAHTAERNGLGALFGVLRWLAVLVGIVTLIFILARADQLRSAAMHIGQLDQTKISSALATLSGAVTVDHLVRDLLTWPQVLAVLLGTLLIGMAYLSWQNAVKRETTPGLLGMFILAIFLAIGGWLLIGELPGAVASGDPDFYNSLLRTATYAFTTVPLEMGLGLIIAYLLFHEVTVGKSLFRIIYFIPYIAPTVATAAVFSVVFSLDRSSPANQFMHAIGLPPQQWLRNPNGIFLIIARIIGGSQIQIPPFLVGPSLPLTTAIFFSVWVFSGYNAVIFMAGLGGVPRELYEAAEVDGAGRWANFRYITLPMISPTTFFLAVLAIIGTFQALSHIYVLRSPASRGSMDVATVLIFDSIRNGLLPYASAMAFVLFAIILVLTLVQNRVAKDQVFYG